jgi:UDP-GlcNAc:undecaprenyl-phosphate/decaprenyl-phosphate GlcNAc-1-phosphate transferase
MTPYLLVFLASLAAALALTPLAQRLSLRWQLLARPGGRRQHKGLIPKFGGLPLWGAFLVGAALSYWLLPPEGDDPLRLRGVLLGGAILFTGGLLDDRYDLSPRTNFFFQFLGVMVAVWHTVFIERFTDPLGQERVIDSLLLVTLITAFWIVGMVNTVNFLDGLDGLAVGVGAIAAVLFAWHSYTLEQYEVALFPLALAGALIGFLPFNFFPARIFLGSAGAYFLGYSLATLSILAPAKIATALLVLAVPILDVAWQIVSRVRHGRSPFQGDRGHLHFRLADLGLPTRQIVLAYYGVALAFGALALVAARPVKLVLLLVLGTAVIALFLRLNGRVNSGQIPSD